jgi:hypothetical protein
MPIFEKKIEKCLSHFNSDFGLVVNFFSSFWHLDESLVGVMQANEFDAQVMKPSKLSMFRG